MATPWSGFTSEDQEKIKSQLEISKSNDLKNADLNKERKMGQRQKSSMSKNPPSSSSLSSSTNDIPNEALFSSVKTRQEKNPESPVQVKLKIVEDSSFEIMEAIPLESNNMCKGVGDEKINGPCDSTTNSPDHSANFPIAVDLLQNGGKKDSINLDEFEKKQKLIEEQNRLKKQMLAKALAMRKMKTQAEAQKINQIQEELSKLDANLSNDVFILRGHIEIASVELAEAEKRYTKAEREFIEAKQLLFSKKERKDLLTEHLCTIIEQNELRKAHRLTDLMVQLDDSVQSLEPSVEQDN